jgi:hypothetical protein
VIAVNGARTLALGLLAAAALPATAAAAGRTAYSIEKASGVQRLSFEADPDTCTQFGVCGEAGTVTQRFGGDPGRGKLVLIRRGRRQTGSARFRSSATTTSSVSGPNGSCRDTVKRDIEWFSLRGSLERLRFRLHPRRRTRDQLRTLCATPTEANLRRDGALPAGTFDADDFRNQRTRFELKGTSVFNDRGYRGELTWNLSYAVKRR